MGKEGSNMSLVICKRNWGAEISQAEFQNVARKIPEVVKTHLETMTGRQRRNNSVKVWVQYGTVHDTGDEDIEIVIFARDVPERQEYLDKRRERLQEAITHLFADNVTFSLWILRAPSSWGERINPV